MRARQRVLEMRGERRADLDAWEELVVRHGLAVTAFREAAAARLLPAATGAFVKIGSPGVVLRGSYIRTAPATPEAYREALVKLRRRNSARGSASVGPHREHPLLGLGTGGEIFSLAASAAIVASVPETDFCFPIVPHWTTATGVSGGIPCAMSDFVQSARLSVPISTTLVPGILAICS